MAIKLKDGFVLRKVGPSHMAVPFGPRAAEVKGMITLSESGYLLWKAIQDGTDTVDGLVAALRAEYDVPEDVAKKDILAFLDGLKEQGALDE